MEQYSRRNSLRLYNLKVPDEIKEKSDLSEFVVQFVNSNLLKVPTSNTPGTISASDIEMSFFPDEGVVRS